MTLGLLLLLLAAPAEAAVLINSPAVMAQAVRPHRQPELRPPRSARTRPRARDLSPRRRAAVILLSVAFFVGIVFYAGRKLKGAFENRPEP